MADAAAHERRPFVYLLITYGNPRNPPQRGGADRRPPRERNWLPGPVTDRAMPPATRSGAPSPPTKSSRRPNWRPGTTSTPPGELVQREGRQDGEGVVTHVPPLHGVAIDEVLQVLQRQTQEECADGAPDFLTAVPGEQEQEECCARKGQPVDFAVQAHNRPGPGGLQGPDDQEQEPCLGDAANDPCALLQCVFDGDSPPDSRIKGIAPKPSGRGGNPGDGKVRSRTGRV